jgi:hypothetical protein
MTNIESKILLESLKKIKDMQSNLTDLQKGLESNDDHWNKVSFAATNLICDYINNRLTSDITKIFSNQEYPY